MKWKIAIFGLCVGLGIGLCALPAPVSAAAPAAAAPAARVTDEQVDAAIRKGLAYLYHAQRDAGTWDSKYARQFMGGTESLVMLAALYAGEDPNKPALKKALDYVNKIEMDSVYTRSVRAMAYARLGGDDNLKRMGQDLAWLLKQQDRQGGWGYGPKQKADWIDTSNTQLAILALGDAADAGAAVAPAIWKRSRSFWVRAQNDDGGWGYEPPNPGKPRLRVSSYGSMTAAGVASLQLTALKLLGQDEPEVAGRKSDATAAREAADKGLAWLGAKFSTTAVPNWNYGVSEDWLLYYLFCLARVTDAGGLRTLGGHDWYPELAASILAHQKPDGSWAAGAATTAAADASGEDTRDAAVRTSFAILALAKSRLPVLMNKISLAGGDTRDAASAAHWFSLAMDWPVTWQQIAPDAPAAVLAEAPLLYIEAGKSALPAALAGAAAQYVRGGGVVLVQSAPGDDKKVAEAFTTLLGEYTAAPLAAEHPMFSVKFPTSPSAVLGVGDGLRTRVFIVSDDWAGVWRRTSPGQSVPQLQQLANLVLYAGDLALPKGRLDLRRPAVAAGSAAVVKTVIVGRVKHTGDWNCCPRAIAALSEAMAGAMSLGVKERLVDLTAPVGADVALLWLTGTGKMTLAGAEVQNLRNYVQGGGTLFVDSAAGGEEFLAQASKFLTETFGPMVDVPADSPLITGKLPVCAGADITSVTFTRALKAKAGQAGRPSLAAVMMDGRAGVILSRYGVTGPMEGLPIYNGLGLSPQDARRLAANVLLYAACK